MPRYFKWIIAGFAALILYAAISGNIGGASKATGNYNEVMTGKSMKGE